ncbi:MAG: NADH-quinone oxidoreductase subunit NuoE [Candidatus Sabulitectum sp.]|nr:NADH-quinone oxidoreductase subunit NuoE [Candidatus Sabulitectum sp.]
MSVEVTERILSGHVDAGRDKLIPILQEVQEALGFLARESVELIGNHLNLPASKIFGVATFYNQFRFEPKGKFHIQICRGTACHVKGSLPILDALVKELDVQPGRTTKDGLFSLEVVACIGACGLAPVIAVNGEFHARLESDQISEIIDSYRKKAM